MRWIFAVVGGGLLLSLLFVFFVFVHIDPIEVRPTNYLRVHNDITKTKSQLESANKIPAVVYMSCDGGLKQDAVFADDYCDCADGSDEVTTNACSFYFPHTKVFDCHDEKHTKIFLSRVNDNVCDCPNGVDEYNSLVMCLQGRRPLSYLQQT